MATVQKRGNTYKVTVNNGIDVTGKQIRKYATFTPNPNATAKQTQKALEKFVFEFEEKVKNGEVLDGRHITLLDFYHKWVNEYCKIHLEETTTSWYQDLYNGQILPALGHLKMSDIKPLHLQTFLNGLSKEGATVDGGAYSPTSVKKYHAALSSLFSTAVKRGIVDSNPTKKVTLPKQKGAADSVQFFTPEQTITFLNALNNSYATTYKAHTRVDDTGKSYNVGEYTEHRYIPTQLKVLFNIAVYGGLRLGELLGLTWDCIDFGNNTLVINKSVARVRGGQNRQIVKVPKNKSSIRTISVPASVMTLIRFWRQEQNQLKYAFGDKWRGSTEYDFLFIQRDGKPMNLSTPYQTFKDIIEKYNRTVDDETEKLPSIRFHDLRHTSATLLISSKKTDVKTVSSRLGHAQTSTTLNIYAHSYKKLDETASDVLEDILQKQVK